MTIRISPEVGAEFKSLADANEVDLTGDPEATCDYLYYDAETGGVGYDGGSPGMYGMFHITDDGYTVALYHDDEVWEQIEPERTEHRANECASCLFAVVQSLLGKAV